MKRDNLGRVNNICDKLDKVDHIISEIKACNDRVNDENDKEYIVKAVITPYKKKYHDHSLLLHGEIVAIVLLHLLSKYETEQKALLEELHQL